MEKVIDLDTYSEYKIDISNITIDIGSHLVDEDGSIITDENGEKLRVL